MENLLNKTFGNFENYFRDTGNTLVNDIVGEVKYRSENIIKSLFIIK